MSARNTNTAQNMADAQRRAYLRDPQASTMNHCNCEPRCV